MKSLTPSEKKTAEERALRAAAEKEAEEFVRKLTWPSQSIVAAEILSRLQVEMFTVAELRLTNQRLEAEVERMKKELQYADNNFKWRGHIIEQLNERLRSLESRGEQG